MVNIISGYFANQVTAFKIAVLNGVKQALLSIVIGILGMVLIMPLCSSEAIAAPFASIGNQLDTVIDTTIDATKQVIGNLQDGRTDKVIDMAANSAKGVAKDVEYGTKKNIAKAKNAVGDRTGKVIDSVKDSLKK